MSKLDFAQKIVPIGYQIISEVAIKWLFDNHRNIYNEFEARVDTIPKINSNPTNKRIEQTQKSRAAHA